MPKQNRDYWVGKVERNRARDAANHEKLSALGWRVETIWECELKDASGLDQRLRAVLSNNSSSSGQPQADPGDPS